MLKGTIIENSLKDKDILKKVKIEKTWHSSNWILHNVWVEKDQIPELSKSLDGGPWYIHLWTPGQDAIHVVYKDKVFLIKSSDKSTWTDAVAYGTSLGIPAEQLDFPID